MNLINRTAFVTSLFTLTTAIASVPSNAQYTINSRNNCSVTQSIYHIFDNQQNNISSLPCIQDSMKTIYNPNPTWQSDL